MSIANFRIVETDRAAFFVTEYDIDHITFTPVDLENLIIEDVRRFYAGVLLNVLETDNRPDTIRDLEERLGIGAASGGGGPGIGGHISIVDITPALSGNVGGKIFSQDNHRIESCISDTSDIRVHIVAITGPTNYKPNVTINGQAVTLYEDSDAPLWEGHIDLVLPLDGLIYAEHEDGASDVSVVSLTSAPQVTLARFSNGYPLGQTELKENDNFQVIVQTDKPINRIQVLNTGACKTKTINISPVTSAMFTVDIANKGNVATPYGCTVIVYDENGSASQPFNTASGGTTDGYHTVILNNTHPSISFNNVDYPAGQQALKGAETATVDFNHTETDSVVFSSPNGQLDIIDPNQLEDLKIVRRNSGGYNVQSSNLSATATRSANGATRYIATVILIADSTPAITVNKPSRLRSGGNQGTSIQSHSVTIISNQRLIETPSLDNVGGQGTFIGNWAGGPSSYSRIMQVHDNDAKGTYDFTNLSVKNLAGIEVNVISGSDTYTLGGFVSRDLFFPAINFEVAIGTQVSDHSKLSTLDKDLVPMTYQNTFSDGSRRYTITGPSSTLNQQGTILFWADVTEVQNNTTGGAFVRIEEVI